MTNEIIELLPSVDLKAKIKDTNHQFTEDELLQIIYRYAPTFELRLSLLERFSEIATPTVSALAKVYMEYEQDNFNRFINAPEGFVYSFDGELIRQNRFTVEVVPGAIRFAVPKSATYLPGEGHVPHYVKEKEIVNVP